MPAILNRPPPPTIKISPTHQLGTEDRGIDWLAGEGSRRLDTVFDPRSATTQPCQTAIGCDSVAHTGSIPVRSTRFVDQTPRKSKR
jgi:hypothetical protein